MQQAYKLSRLYALTDKNGITDSCFHTRFGANFPIIYDLFEKLYHSHPHKKEAFENLIQILVEKFKDEVPKYMIKHHVRPGMSGWAQINGFRGNTSIFKRIEHDIYYVENWTLSMDVVIFFRTLINLFRDKNAY